MSVDAEAPLSSIPTVDLRDLDSADPTKQRAAAQAILRGYGDFGLVYISNHGVDQAEVAALYAEFIAFTERPTAEKAGCGGPDIWYQRGWTPPNTERAVVAGGQPDFKECWFSAPLPFSHRSRRDFPELYCDNVWPERAERFRELNLKLGAAVHAVGLKMLEGCALALDLPRDTFTGLVEGGAHVTRLLRYLALNQQQVGTDILWGEEHTDFNLLTLLPGGQFYAPSGEACERPDSESGLYLRARPTDEHPHGRMVRGVAPAGCMVSQVGQQLEILTGGRLLATPHVIRAPHTPGYTRCSLAHFIHVEGHQTLFPLEPLLTEENAAAYRPPILAGNYGLKTLVDIQLAPREALDRLGFRHYDRLSKARAALG